MVGELSNETGKGRKVIKNVLLSRSLLLSKAPNLRKTDVHWIYAT